MNQKKVKDTYQSLLHRLAYEQRALGEDDPTSNCAAYHRGAIAAYELMRDELAECLLPADIARITAAVQKG